MLLYFEKNLIDNNNSMLGTQKGLTSLPWGLVLGLGSPCMLLVCACLHVFLTGQISIIQQERMASLWEGDEGTSGLLEENIRA